MDLVETAALVHQQSSDYNAEMTEVVEVVISSLHLFAAVAAVLGYPKTSAVVVAEAADTIAEASAAQ